MNSFGNIYRLTTFGESHGPAIGGVIDGVPAGVKIDFDSIDRAMARRRPGQSSLTTARKEDDKVNFLSGILDGITIGTPIGFIIQNTDHHSTDYEDLRHTFRPSHADFTYTQKYGIRDHRGGGRASARETAARIVAGEIASQILKRQGIDIRAYTAAIGSISAPDINEIPTIEQIDSNAVRCPDQPTALKMQQTILEVKKAGDSIGGIIKCFITGLPAGLGDPIFDKLQSRLAAAMLSIPAVKGFDYGMGFEGCSMLGSQMIDPFTVDRSGAIHTTSNHSGGIQGGISNGETIHFRVGFKPTATLLRELPTVDDQANATTIKVRGRHDPCVVPRAVPIVEAMAACVILDAWLANRTSRIDQIS